MNFGFNSSKVLFCFFVIPKYEITNFSTLLWYKI